MWPHAADAGLAVLAFVLEVVGILARAVNESGAFSLSMLGDIPVATYLLLAVSSVALLWRRNHPLAVLAATLTAAMVWDLLSLANGPSLAILISLYGVGRFVEEDRTNILAVVAAMIITVADDLLIEGEDASVVVLSLGLVFLAWYVGRRMEGRREYLALLEERAEYLERERVAEAQRAVTEERTRIARELHDVVAHRVSMITVQAGAAQTVAVSDPDRAVRAMEAIEGEGREALEELRQILGVLRSEGGGTDLLPVHGLADIGDLVAEMSSAGMEVSLFNDVDPGDIPAQLDLASYRIVQEALTNVVKHGGPAPRAEVRISSDDEALTIEVTDNGSGVSMLPGSGHGLAGMRERTALLGGTFEAGPRPQGGFRVIARLPLETKAT
ncbi:MAG: sensor histidine kinase [Acidimicrobiia bacterium]|jgi:signal transduction histidine kinase